MKTLNFLVLSELEMMYIRYAVFLPILILVYALSYIIAPFLATASVVLGRDQLPSPWNWFYTHDDTLDGGQHQLGWPQKSGVGLIWQRMNWIWRNPGYRFAAYFLGFPDDQTVFLEDTGAITTHGEVYAKRWVVMKNTSNGRKYFSFRRDIPWGNRYVKIWLGWSYAAQGGLYNPEKTHMMKCNINPWMTRGD